MNIKKKSAEEQAKKVNEEHLLVMLYEKSVAGRLISHHEIHLMKSYTKSRFNVELERPHDLYYLLYEYVGRAKPCI